MSTDKVIFTIRKLLALSREGSGATEHEALLAAEKARELMEEHNLTVSQTEIASGKSEARSRDQVGVKRAMYKWQRDLMIEIARTNLCHLDIVQVTNEEWTQKTGRHTTMGAYQLIGRQVNVTAATVLFDYLHGTIMRLSMDHVDNVGSRAQSREANLFRSGCAERLESRLRSRHYERLAQQKAEAEAANERARQANPSGFAVPALLLEDVVQRESDLNNDFICDLEPGTTATQRRERQARYERRQAEREAKIIELVASLLVSRDIAYWMAEGYSRERAEALCLTSTTEDTPESKAKRERRQRRWDEQSRRSWERRAKREAHPSYRAGSEAGARVGLDEQVDHSETRRLS